MTNDREPDRRGTGGAGATRPRDDLGPTWRWVVGVLLTVMMAGVANAVRVNADDVDEVQATNAVQDREISAIKAAAELRGQQLDRIERKIDRVLEGGR